MIINYEVRARLNGTRVRGIHTHFQHPLTSHVQSNVLIRPVFSGSRRGHERRNARKYVFASPHTGDCHIVASRIIALQASRLQIETSGRRVKNRLNIRVAGGFCPQAQWIIPVRTPLRRRGGPGDLARSLHGAGLRLNRPPFSHPDLPGRIHILGAIGRLHRGSDAAIRVASDSMLGNPLRLCGIIGNRVHLDELVTFLWR